MIKWALLLSTLAAGATTAYLNAHEYKSWGSVYWLITSAFMFLSVNNKSS